MTADEVACCLGISLRSVWRWTASGLLPPPVRMGGRRTRWLRTEVLAFAAQLRARRLPPLDGHGGAS